MNSLAAGGPPAELVPSGDASRAPLSPPVSRQATEDGLPFVCLPGTSPPARKQVRERLFPRSSLSRGAASSFVSRDRARCSGGWREKRRLPSTGRAHGQKDATLSGPGCSHPRRALGAQAPGPSVRGGRGPSRLYTCGVPAPPPSRSARPGQEARRTLGAQDAGDGASPGTRGQVSR